MFSRLTTRFIGFGREEPALKILLSQISVGQARVRYDLIPERARAWIRLAASSTASQNGRFVAVPERSSCFGLKGDDIRGHRACVGFACCRNRIIRPSNLFDPGAFPRGRVAFSS